MPARHVFTYGSLMFEPVWQYAVRGRYRSGLAVAAGFRRFGVNDETYPAVLRDAGSRVGGRVYLDVEQADLQRLDEFEGDDYQRITVPVLLSDAAALGLPGNVIDAQIYLYRRPDRVTAADWDVGWFEAEGLQRFIARFCRPPESV